MRVLLVYASTHGSTAEVAEVMAQVLREQGLDVTLANAEDNPVAEGYDAYLLGSAIYKGLWLPEAVRFLRHSRSTLRGKPLYCWVTCIRVLEPEGLQHVVENYMPDDLLQGLDVRSIMAFAGKLDLSEVEWDERWTLAIRYDGHKAPNEFNGDLRNWAMIRRWALNTATELLAQ